MIQRDALGRFARAPAEPATEQPAEPATEQPAEPAEDAACLADQLRIALLRRMAAMVDALPGGYYTEIKGQLAEGAGGLVGTFKLRDFAASLKDLAGTPARANEGEIEDLSPLVALLGGDEDDVDDEEED